MSRFETGNPSPYEAIIDDLVRLITRYEIILAEEGKAAADEFWTEVRNSFLSGVDAMSDDVFYEFVVEAERIRTIKAREASNG
jgi:hypothetical protein